MAKKRTTPSSSTTVQQGDAGAQSEGLGLNSGMTPVGGGQQDPSQSMPQQTGNDPFGAILGGLLGGGGLSNMSGGMPSQTMGAQSGGLDIGGLLSGMLGGGMSGGVRGGIMGGAAGAILGPLANSISQKTGLPSAIVMAGASFLLSKLLNGGLSGSMSASSVGSAAQNLPAHPSGGIDLGSILGSILGGGAGNMGGNMPAQGGGLGSILGSILGGGMPSQTQQDSTAYPDPQAQQQAPQGSVDVPAGDKVLGKIGQSADNATPQATPQGGINIQGLTVGNEHQFVSQNGLASEFARQTGLDEHTAAQSLSAILHAMHAG